MCMRFIHFSNYMGFSYSVTSTHKGQYPQIKNHFKYRHPQGKKVCIPPLEVCIPPPTLLHNFHILSLTRSKQSSCKRVTSDPDQECTHQEPRGKYRNSSARSRHIPEAASVQLQDLALLMGITHSSAHSCTSSQKAVNRYYSSCCGGCCIRMCSRRCG